MAIIDIPKRIAFNQKNEGELSGSIWATKNIDPEINRGKINVSKVMGYRTNTDDQSNLGAPASAFAFSDDTTDKYYCIADDRVWETAGINPNGIWTEVASTGTDYDINSDLKFFNSKLYLSSTAQLRSYTQSGGFSDIGTLGSDPHSMTVFANRLYVSDLGDRVYSMNTAETLSKSGSNTINLNTTTGNNQLITKIDSVSNGIWIATTFTDRAGGEVIFWDGETENVAEKRYVLKRGALSMVIKDDRPYIVDTLGRLRVFDGTTFVEIARFPIKDELLDNFSSNDNNKWIHPNGMIEVNDEIYILCSNLIDDSTKNTIENMPAGVWAFSPLYGLYHKYSFVDADLSSATIKDFGAGELAQTGALFHTTATGGGTVSLANDSEIFAGIKYYSNATATKAAIGITDVANTEFKGGYFVTSEIQAEEFDDAWKEVVALYDRMSNATDRVTIKYRTHRTPSIYGTGTWSDDDTFTSSNDLSSVKEGWEIEGLRGNGAGTCFTVDSISGTYTVNLERNPHSSMSGTFTFRAQNWTEIGSISDTDSHILRKSMFGGDGGWVQVKVCLEGAGHNPQINRLIVKSNNQSNYK